MELTRPSPTQPPTHSYTTTRQSEGQRTPPSQRGCALGPRGAGLIKPTAAARPRRHRRGRQEASDLSPQRAVWRFMDHQGASVWGGPLAAPKPR